MAKSGNAAPAFRYAPCRLQWIEMAGTKPGHDNATLRVLRLGLVEAALGDDLAAMLLDRVGEGLPILDLQSPMVDARAGTGELRFGGALAVIEHEREIGLAVGHM